MMKKALGKGVLSVFLAVNLVASSLPYTVFAENIGNTTKNNTVTNKTATQETDCTQYVNTFVGTDVDGGQLFPGAVTPSGLVKLSPDTYPHNDNDHAGYDYSKTQISGFSHTRVEGVGGSGAGGDLLVTPSYLSTTNKPSDSEKAQTFTHDSEVATPGYYKVDLTPKKGAGTVDNSIGKIKAELTTNNNVGLHKYTFPKKGAASLSLDLGYGYNGRSGRKSTLEIKTESGKTFFEGSIEARTVGNHTTYKLYYYGETNIPAVTVKTWGVDNGLLDESSVRSGAEIGAVLNYNVEDNSSVQVKVAMSTISTNQAKRDMQAQISGWDFNAVKDAAKAKWNSVLGRVSVKTTNRSDLERKYDEVYESFYKQAGKTPETNVYSQGGSMAKQAELTEAQEDTRLKILFYTHLYHMFTTPVNATSTDNTYRVNSNLIKEADDFTYYDSWSLWDDFRKYPVLGLVAPDIYKNQIKSIANLAQYGVGNLYGSSLSTNTVPTVRAEHAVALLADGVAKGFTDMDNLEIAYERFKTLSNGYWGSGNLARGYYSGNVGNTVEYSYDDWAISLIARYLNKSGDITEFSNRALNYRNLFRKDALTKSYNGIQDKISILWPKNDDKTWKDSSASATDLINKAEQYGYGGYQGTIWQYSLWDSYDIAGLMRLMGDGDLQKGKAEFLKYLRYLYGMNVNTNSSYSELQNAVLHSNANEIDLQTPYMFNVAGKPSLTQYWTRQIYTKASWNSYSGTGRNNTAETKNQKPIYVYKLDPYGFMETMDDDCGTMAGNFVAAAMGLYPMTPGDTTYQITSPFFSEMTIDLGNNKSFTIKANGVSSKNFYIQSAKLNGKAFNRSWIDYSEIARGGVLEFTMGSEPSTWAENGQSVPSVDDLNGKSVAEYLNLPALTYSKVKLNVDPANNGIITDTVTIIATNNIKFTGVNNEDFVANGKAVVSNLPNGLTAKIKRVSDTSAQLSFTGKATNNQYNSYSLSIAFVDTAFNGLKANEVVNAYKANLNALVLDFKFDNKIKLQNFVNEVKNTTASDYTATSYIAFYNALTASTNVLASQTSTETDFENSYLNLYTAYVQLVKKASGYAALTGNTADVYLSCYKSDGYTIGIKDGSAVAYKVRDFGKNGAAAATIKYAKVSKVSAPNSKVEIRAGGVNGQLIKTVNLPDTGADWSTQKTIKVYFEDPSVLKGIQDVYLVFKSENKTSMICLFYEMKFTEAGGYGKVEAENFYLASTTSNPFSNDKIKIESGASGQNIGGTANGAWLAYEDMNFTGIGLKEISIRYAHNTGRCGENAKAEFRLDSVDGTLVGTIDLSTTGGWSDYVTKSVNVTSAVTGKHVVYVVLLADTSSAKPFVSNIDYFEFAGVADKSNLNKIISQVENAKYSSNDYTAPNLADLASVLAKAKTVAQNDAVTQEAIDAAADDLDKGVKALVRIPRVTSITLSCGDSATGSNVSTSILIGKNSKIKAQAYIKGALSTNILDNTFDFISSNPAIVSVDNNGNVKALKVGTAKITVQATDGSNTEAICTITVKPIAVTSIKLAKKSATLTVGGKVQIKATVTPFNETFKEVTYKSNKTSIATVSSNGTVTAKGAGIARITVASGGKVTTYTVTVKPDKATKVKVTKSGKNLTVKFTKGKGSAQTQIVVYRNGNKYKTKTTSKKSESFKGLKKGTYKVKLTAIKKVSGKNYKSSTVASKSIKIK